MSGSEEAERVDPEAGDEKRRRPIFIYNWQKTQDRGERQDYLTKHRHKKRQQADKDRAEDRPQIQTKLTSKLHTHTEKRAGRLEGTGPAEEKQDEGRADEKLQVTPG